MNEERGIIPPLASRSHLALTEPELVAWGERFGRAARPPLVVTVSGELGAGKTTLARAICRGYGVQDDVTSPTFTIVHEYAGGLSPVLHVDLYRLRGPRELAELGWDELVASHALVLIEWPERARGLIPTVHVPIQLQHVDDTPGRRLLYAGGHVGEGQFGDHS
ncbi:MAG TPA: tRNA (adenosine(37)-N6)-threonylcarbamoyltransferase complex ATPase subunit type 1 TsaE [Gemmatimonadaceae bacterium]|nr:tRNA (adenosine(37)-N6)-threonylcarbamoyltransferase complex ATPase subunit type 1 TsaE [Gemmatimonadaceae bacterium]